jgi:ABC-type multidrug transport system fused ATPase/permease subunit
LNTAHQTIDGQSARVRQGYRPHPPGYHHITPRQVFAEFYAYARPQLRVFGIILLSVLLQGGVAGGTIFLLKRALDRFFESNSVSTMLFLIGTLFLATVFKSSLEFVFNWKKSVAVARIHDQLLVSAFRDLLYNPFRYHVMERDRSKYSWVLKDSIKFIEAFFGMFNAWAKQPVVLFSTIAALWVISPLLTLVGIVLVPLGIPCVVYLKRKVKSFVAQRKTLLGVTEEMVSETIRSIRIVKVFGMEEDNVNKLRQTIDRQRDINLKNAFYMGLMSPLSELLGFIGLAVIIIAGSQKIIGGDFSTGTFFVFIMAFLNIYRPLKDISNGYMNYQLALDAGRRLIVLRRRAARPRQHAGRIPLTHFEGLTLEDIWFSYQAVPAGEDDYVLRRLSMQIRQGETVAVVGATGAGKSTLCDLICRLYEPQRGRLLVNAQPAVDIRKADFTQSVALCSQETIVFNNSLYDEIRIANAGATRAQVEEAARAAGLTAYLSAIGRDLDTWIGDRGIQFSGGQRQMIAIARALLRKPRLMIMDEAMSGLDVETSRTIWQNIRTLLPDVTLLVVSHNWDIIKHCQRALVLKAGTIETTLRVADIDDPAAFFRRFHDKSENGQP